MIFEKLGEKVQITISGVKNRILPRAQTLDRAVHMNNFMPSN